MHYNLVYLLKVLREQLFMFYKFFISIFMVLFVAACATTPKDSADSSGSGSSSSGSDVSSEGTITETSGSGIVSGSQED